MKLFFSLLLPVICLSTEPILISYNAQERKALALKRVMVKNLNLPSALIDVRYQALPCQADDFRLIHFCIEKNKQVELIKYEQETVRNAFEVFFKEEENEK